MRVEVKHHLDGIIQAEGMVVVIDVLRSSATILTLLNNGISKIYPVRTLERAYEIKNDGSILVGEQEGSIAPGFHYANSPSSLDGMPFQGKDAILMTGAGSPGIIAASHVIRDGGEVVVGCFLNASAVERHIVSKHPKVVTLVPLGRRAREPAIEDEVFAKYLDSRLRGDMVDFEDARDDILNGTEANESVLKYLDDRDFSHPKKDLYFCLRLDVFNLVPKVFIENGVPVIKRSSQPLSLIQ